MQFLSMVKSRENQGPPPAALFEAMGGFVEKYASAGKVVTMGGLAPTAAGFTVTAGAGSPVVTDGPFAEATEVVGGYAILEVGSRAEAEEICAAFIQLHMDTWPEWRGTSEVRLIAE